MRRLLLTMGLMMASVANVAAQEEKSTELSVGIGSMGLSFTGGDNYFIFEVNERYLAASFYRSPTLAIRPFTAITLTSGGGASFSVVKLGVAVPIYSEATWGRSGFYYAPRASLTVYSADFLGLGGSESQLALGISVGKKIPVVDAVSIDLSGSFDYSIDTDVLDDVVDLAVHLGLSVFLP